jgi:hypothetical protein
VRFLNFAFFLAKNLNFFFPLIYLIRLKGILPLGQSSQFTSKNHNILLISKTGFIEDFKIISTHKNNIFNFFVLNRNVADIIAKGFLPIDQQMDYLSNEYYHSKFHADLQSFWIKLFHKLDCRYNFKGLVSGSWVYWNERDLHEALTLCNFPVVILYKEAVMSKKVADYLISTYRSSRQFFGNSILVYSDTQRNRLISGKVTIPEKISVVGSPRFDVLLSRANSTQLPDLYRESFKVIFFLHDNFLGDPEASLDLEFSHTIFNARLDLINVAFQLALFDPSFFVVIKTKVSKTTVRTVRIIEAMLPKLSNLIFVYGGMANDSLVEARLTVAFNSTSTLDSVAAGIETVLYRPSYSMSQSELLIDFGSEIEVCSSKKELIDLVIERFSSTRSVVPYSPSSKSLLLNTFVGNSDAKASERVLLELRKIFL